MVRGVLNCSEERSAFHKLDKCIKIGEEPSEYTTFGNLECSKNGNNGAAFLAIRNAA